MGGDIQTERGSRVEANAAIFQGPKGLPEKRMMTIFETSAARQMLEDSWRLRLEETQVHYRKAADEYRKLLQEQPDGTPHDPNGALALARQAESEALAEHTRVLRIFTELILNGKIPEERSVAGSNGI